MSGPWTARIPTTVTVAVGVGVWIGTWAPGTLRAHRQPAVLDGQGGAAAAAHDPRSIRDSSLISPAQTAGIPLPAELEDGPVMVSGLVLRADSAPAGRAYVSDFDGALASAELAAQPALGGAPTELVTTLSPAAGSEQGADSLRETGREAPKTPYSPVRRLGAAAAAGIPLLGVHRGGDRLVVLETAGGATLGAAVGLEGTWAVVGQCSREFRVEFAQPVRQIGQVSGIGRLPEGGGPWSAGPVVPAQGCMDASRRWTAAGAVTPREVAVWRESLGGEEDVVADGAVSLGPDAAVLLLRGGEAAEIVALERGAEGWRRAWSSDTSLGATLAGGPVRLLGTYRRGRVSEVWLSWGDPSSPDGFARLERSEEKEWRVEWSAVAGG